MKTVTFKATTETAYGKALKTPIAYEGQFQAFETIDEIRSVGEFPTDKDIINFVNAGRKASARAKSLTAALDAAGYEKPTMESDVLMQLKTLYKVFIAAKKPHDEARALAAANLNVEWPDGE